MIFGSSNTRQTDHKNQPTAYMNYKIVIIITLIFALISSGCPSAQDKGIEIPANKLNEVIESSADIDFLDRFNNTYPNAIIHHTFTADLLPYSKNELVILFYADSNSSACIAIISEEYQNIYNLGVETKLDFIDKDKVTVESIDDIPTICFPLRYRENDNIINYRVQVSKTEKGTFTNIFTDESDY